MTWILAVLLAVTFGVAAIKLRRHRRALRELESAIAQRQPLLREERSVLLGADWDRLCESANALCQEVNRLQQSRAGQLAQLEATLGSLQEAVLIVDDTNRILLANQALQQIFPAATDILGRRLELVLHSREFLDYVETVRHGQAKPQTAFEFTRGNDSVWLEVTGALIPPLEGDQTQWTLFVLHDITRQRKLEGIRKDFVANVSHELRTPLSVIKGCVETLIDDLHGMAAEDRERFLRTVQRHTERLNSLLEDLLVLSRLESTNPGLAFETVDFAHLVGEIVREYQSRPSTSGRKLIFVPDERVGQLRVDPLRITQVMENLLENAVKYTPQNAYISIVLEPRDREVQVYVRDNGPGIPAEDLPHLFERFYRVDKGRSREKGGTGLGLSIAKHIVQLHGGRVGVESVLGQGTVFHFTLPRPAAS